MVVVGRGLMDCHQDPRKYAMDSNRGHGQVKNKAPAEIQITAEQLLREAKERDLEILPPLLYCASGVRLTWCCRSYQHLSVLTVVNVTRCRGKRNNVDSVSASAESSQSRERPLRQLTSLVGRLSTCEQTPPFCLPEYAERLAGYECVRVVTYLWLD
ncbi:hypothetical protein PR048_007478 [Dryococelus australis]|uniref:Uncharacterized protein n=1 Tax=Dryococelus australis TaxID=614101 RepID=A0ABQ9HW15_9NEOP|nr:hypothetical protein PR048_007478 [Dryococelus australis]